MNKTLNDYINRANEIQNNKTRCIRYNIKTINQSEKNELMHMIDNLEKALRIVKTTYNYISNAENLIHMEKSQVDDNPVNNIILKNVKSLAFFDESSIRNISKNVLYWLPELNQYIININNMILRGNIGNIYDKKIIQNNKIKAHQVVICAEANNCKNVLSEQYCKFWHDPVDLIVLKDNKIISDEYYYRTIQHTRNFANTSWIYSSDKPTANSNMRHIGAASRLRNDIALCKISNIYKTQIKNLKAQIMHDLLILLTLHEQGLA